MSGTESIGALLIFLGVIIALGVLFPAFSGFTDSVSDSISSQIDTNREIQNSDININATIQNDELDIQINNTGTTGINLDNTNVLIDGVVEEEDTVTIDGTERSVFYGGETANLGFEDEQDAERVKVVVQKAISDIDTDIQDLD